MVLLNYATKEIVAKIVYYGPGLCGKTTNLQSVYAKLNPKKRGKMISLATEADRTLFFDFLPLELGTIQGFKVRFQLYTVPGQVFYASTRKLVLKGADAVVFVADSQTDVFDKNVESIEDMRQNLIDNGLDPDTIPVVMQYNKRDLPNVMSIEELNEKLNPKGFSHLGAAAVDGTGVVETFKEITRLVIVDLKRKHAFIDTDKIKELPADIFEQKKEPPKPSKQDASLEIELGSAIEPSSDEVFSGELLDQIETFSVNDYHQAEEFFDDVRKGASVQEAKKNVGRKPAASEAIDLSDFPDDDVVIEHTSGLDVLYGTGERELAPEELDFVEPTVEAPVKTAPPVQQAQATPRPQQTAPTAPPSRVPPAVPVDLTPVISALVRLEKAFTERPVTEAPTPPAPVDLSSITAALERLEKTVMERPTPEAAPPPVKVDISPVLLAVDRLGNELAQLREEIAGLREAQQQAALPPLEDVLKPTSPIPDVEASLQAARKEILGSLEGQDRLLLSLLEATRENKKGIADSHETIEAGLKYLIDIVKGRPEDSGKKKWF